MKPIQVFLYFCTWTVQGPIRFVKFPLKWNTGYSLNNGNRVIRKKTWSKQYKITRNILSSFLSSIILITFIIIFLILENRIIQVKSMQTIFSQKKWSEWKNELLKFQNIAMGPLTASVKIFTSIVISIFYVNGHILMTDNVTVWVGNINESSTLDTNFFFLNTII